MIQSNIVIYNSKNNQNINYFCFYWALIPERQMKIYISIKNRMYLVDSIGGGYATIKNINMAHRCLVQLYNLAYLIKDNEVIAKCKIYYGYIFLWKGKIKQAKQIFNTQKSIAQKNGYKNILDRSNAGLYQIANQYHYKN